MLGHIFSPFTNFHDQPSCKLLKMSNTISIITTGNTNLETTKLAFFPIICISNDIYKAMLTIFIHLPGLTWRLSRMPLQQPKHISTGFADSGHLGYNGQVMDDKANFVLLYSGQVVGVTQQTKAGDICGTVCVVFMHQAGSCKVQTASINILHKGMSQTKWTEAFHVLAWNPLLNSFKEIPAYNRKRPILFFKGDHNTHIL